MEVEALAGTNQWHAARRGCLTASRMADAIAVLKNGKPSEARRKLMFDLLAERMSGVAVEHYVTPAMEWGIAHQADAMAAYEAETGELVGPEVFVLHPSIDWFGATPDGLVGSDGLVEIKCPTTPKFLAWRMAGEVPEEHRPQMLAQLACTGRQWVDFVAFDPRVQKGPQLFIRRFQPERAEIERIEAGARDFLAELAAMEIQLEAA
ncbi:MAG: YqaJ-like viral recombinase domain protein [Chloroflexi bacterium OLB13]|nr:MAG: YqaJ-like viral recombinase domain protein [Chloroflexi bacterium OLB13]